MADQSGYLYLATVGGRAAADTLALQWAADIGRHGRPQGVEPAEVVADRTDLTGL